MLRRLALVALCIPLLALTAGAADADRAEVRLITGWSEPDGTRIAAIEIRLAPGWHTYWRAPGASGIAPQFDWSGSRNLRSIRYEWPRPVVFETFGTRSIGYRDRLVLPVMLTPEQADQPIDLDLDLFFGVCRDICVPASAELVAAIGPAAPEAGAADIRAALATRAQDSAEAGVVGVNCRVEPRDGGHAVTAEIRFTAPPVREQVAVLEAGNPDLWIGEAVLSADGATLTAEARIETYGGTPLVLDRSELRLTILDDERAVDIRGCSAR
jgi:DsbC/DsbD-like thiol-disulfide interchange protein